MTKRPHLVALALLAIACEKRGESGAAPEAGAPAVASAVASDAAPVGERARPKSVSAAPDGSGRAAQRTGGLESAELVRIVVDRQGAVAAELATAPTVRVVVELSTKQQPLSYRAPVAYYRVAEQLAPGLVPETVLRVLSLAELSRAAQDERARRLLRREARVLSDGTVRAAVTRAPDERTRVVDVADLTQGGLAWSWENKLVSRNPTLEAEAPILASYQALLVVDYVVGNLRRRHARLDEKQGRLTVVEENDVFSSRGVEGAVGDSLVRLLRFMTYSKSATRRLSALSREKVAQLLRGQGEQLVTPKQIDEIVSRKQSLEKMIKTRVEQRGEDKALALP